MEANLAVLIDFENIAAGAEKEGLGRFDIEAVMQRIKDKGRVLIARSYADWGRFSRFKQGLLAQNVTMMELTSHGMQDKNRADIALVVDALELAFTKDYVDTFVIVSGDSDFTPMVQKMRELNKRVIGLGTRKSTSRLLIQACDEFVFYDAIVKPKTPKKRRAAAGSPAKEGVLTKEAAWSLLVDAVEGLQRENPDPPLAGVVKQAMLRKSPDFSESEFGYTSFTRFLEAAQDAGHVRVIRDNKAGGVRVDVVDSGDAEPDLDAGAEPAAPWSDPYLPEGSEVWTEALAEQGLHPLSHATRMAILEALVDEVEARRKRRRKSTIQFVAEDVKKKLRRTHPDLPLPLIRGVLEALRRAEQLLHRDGAPVRTHNASFRLDKDATGLNEALLGTYLAHLKEAGAELADAAGLAELFLGNRDRAREVEEAVAWMHAPEPEIADLNDRDLDDLLVPADAQPVETRPEPAEKPKRKRVRAREEAPAAEEGSSLDALLDAVEPAAEAEEASAEEAPAQQATDAPEPAEDAPPKKKTTRKRKPRKVEEAAE